MYLELTTISTPFRWSKSVLERLLEDVVRSAITSAPLRALADEIRLPRVSSQQRYRSTRLERRAPWFVAVGMAVPEDNVLQAP